MGGHESAASPLGEAPSSSVYKRRAARWLSRAAFTEEFPAAGRANHAEGAIAPGSERVTGRRTNPLERSDHMAKDHGSSIKDDKQYEGLKKKGMSKSRAAAIANSPDS